MARVLLHCHLPLAHPPNIRHAATTLHFWPLKSGSTALGRFFGPASHLRKPIWAPPSPSKDPKGAWAGVSVPIVPNVQRQTYLLLVGALASYGGNPSKTLPKGFKDLEKNAILDRCARRAHALCSPHRTVWGTWQFVNLGILGSLQRSRGVCYWQINSASHEVLFSFEQIGLLVFP